MSFVVLDIDSRPIAQTIVSGKFYKSLSRVNLQYMGFRWLWPDNSFHN
jgi:hypothetical protein